MMAAIGWHALVDAVAVFAGVSTGVYGGSVGGTVITELLIAGLAAISLGMLFRLRPAATSPGSGTPAPPPHTGPVQAGEPRADRIEASRFTDRGEP